MVGARFFNDDPVDGSREAPDLLGREPYARHAITLLQRVRAQSESGVLALIGPWGAGKSSVLQMMLQRLEAENNRDTGWLVAELNPWLYTDLDSLVLALFSEIRAALPRGRRWSEARKRIGEFGQAVSPLGKATAAFGLDSEGVIKEFSRRLSGEATASAARHRVERALRKADRPILVVMDDVDRLTADELLLLFKLVRLVGRLPNVYYVLSFDEQTLLDVLRRSDLARDDEYRAQEFLEKIVQVRLDLPAFREKDGADLVDRSMDVIVRSHELAMTEQEQRRFADAYFRHLQVRLATPRAVKRFFAQVDATLGSVVGEVDLVDFLIVTFLRVSEPGVYRMLVRRRAELTGTESGIFAADRRMRPEERAEMWRSRLRSAGVAEENLEGMRHLLAMVFPAVQKDIGEATHHQDPAARRGIGSSDYFDRYLVFGVPDDDLSEAAFDEGLAQLRGGAPGEESAAVLEWVQRDTHRFVRRVQQRRAAGSPLPARELLQELSHRYGQLTPSREGLGLVDAQMVTRFLARDLLVDLPPDQRARTLWTMAATLDGVALAGYALLKVSKPDDDDSRDAATEEDWVIQARALLDARIAHNLSFAATQPPQDLTEAEVTAIWAWRHTAPDSARTWIHQRLNDSWALLPLLARLIPDNPPFPLIDTDTLAGLDALIGLDELYTRIDALPHPPSNPETHEEKIHQALRHHRDNTA